MGIYLCSKYKAGCWDCHEFYKGITKCASMTKNRNDYASAIADHTKIKPRDTTSSGIILTF